MKILQAMLNNFVYIQSKPGLINILNVPLPANILHLVNQFTSPLYSKGLNNVTWEYFEVSLGLIQQNHGFN